MTGYLATPRRRSPHWGQSSVEELSLLGSDIGTHRAAVRVLGWCRSADSTCKAVNNYCELRPQHSEQLRLRRSYRTAGANVVTAEKVIVVHG